jgi:hypothetical protein
MVTLREAEGLNSLYLDQLQDTRFFG